MKKILALFVILDLIFVGVILKISPTTDTPRSIASLVTDKSEGQLQKQSLIESLEIALINGQIALKSEVLLDMCKSYEDLQINLVFQGNIAVAGESPQILKNYPCREMINSEVLAINTSEFTIEAVANMKIYFADEFPNMWTLSEMEVSSSREQDNLHFTINSNEMNAYAKLNRSFKLTSEK